MAASSASRSSRPYVVIERDAQALKKAKDTISHLTKRVQELEDTIKEMETNAFEVLKDTLLDKAEAMVSNAEDECALTSSYWDTPEHKAATKRLENAWEKLEWIKELDLESFTKDIGLDSPKNFTF
jgi:DNA recombination-dependent growth factor C